MIELVKGQDVELLWGKNVIIPLLRMIVIYIYKLLYLNFINLVFIKFTTIVAIYIYIKKTSFYPLPPIMNNQRRQRKEPLMEISGEILL